MLIVVGQIGDAMDMLSPPSDEFAKHDSRIASVKKNNFHRLAGKMHVYVAYTSLPVPVTNSVSYTGRLHFLTWHSLSQFAEWKFGLSTHLSQKWSDFAERKSYVQKYGLSTYLDWSLV